VKQREHKIELDLQSGLVVLDEVRRNVVFVEIFTAIGSVTRLHLVVTSKPLNNRLSHVDSSVCDRRTSK